MFEAIGLQYVGPLAFERRTQWLTAETQQRCLLLLQSSVEPKPRSYGRTELHFMNWGYGWSVLCIKCQKQSTRYRKLLLLEMMFLLQCLLQTFCDKFKVCNVVQPNSTKLPRPECHDLQQKYYYFANCNMQAFKPIYWAGEIYLDAGKEFFALAGRGQLRQTLLTPMCAKTCCKVPCVTRACACRKGSQLTFFNPFSSVWKTAIAAKNTVDDFNFKVHEQLQHKAALFFGLYCLVQL